jgi:hypothetical protein
VAKRASRFERVIDRIEEIPNTWDDHGRAYKVTLRCGHHCFLTGSAIMNRQIIECKPCAQEED